MSKFKNLECIGSEKEISKIVDSTIGTLKREFKIIVNQEVIIPAMVNSFIDAAIYKSLELLGDNNIKSELNLFEMIRIIHEIVPGEETPELVTTITLGRMAIRRLELKLPDEDVEEAMNNITDVDVNLLEEISIKALQYLESRHNLTIRDYQLMFKVAEVFFNEMISYIKVNSVTDDILIVFEQFSILLDETGRFESIELSKETQEIIQTIHKDILDEAQRLQDEDDEFAKNSLKSK